MKNNSELQTDVQDAIKWEPLMHASEIGVTVKDNWNINDNDITVQATGHTVKLTGTVNSWFQKDEAARMAWDAPGVWSVENELAVDYV